MVEAKEKLAITNKILVLKNSLEDLKRQFSDLDKIAKIQLKINNLQNQVRFSSYLSFLHYEILIGFDTVTKVKDHIKEGVACPSRINLILKYSNLDINSLDENLKIQELIKKIPDLSTNTEFTTKWQKHEFEDRKWSTYES